MYGAALFVFAPSFFSSVYVVIFCCFLFASILCAVMRPMPGIRIRSFHVVSFISARPLKCCFASAIFGSSSGSMSSVIMFVISFSLYLYSFMRKSALYNLFCLFCVSASLCSSFVPLTGVNAE